MLEKTNQSKDRGLNS